jgi:hypothetical protein
MSRGMKLLWSSQTPAQLRAAMHVLDAEEAKQREEARKKHPYYRS